MYTTIVILILLTSVLLCLVVLVQESKGGGLAADYANGNALLGAPKTTNVIQKITIGLAAVMVVLSILSAAFIPETKATDSVLQMEQPAASTLPAIPAATATPAQPAADAPAQPAADAQTAN